MSFTVKAYLIKDLQSDEIRRFAVDQDVSTSHDYLREKIQQIFPGLKRKVFDVYWKDGEGDMIAFSSDEEQLEALSFVTDGVFKVYIKQTHGGKTTPQEPKDEESETTHGGPKLHPGIVCDECEGSVKGCRYKCTVCPDYDLCSPCKEKGTHKEHNMMAIPTPMFGGWMGFMPPFHQPPHHGHGPPPPHHGHPPPPPPPFGHPPPPPPQEGECPEDPWGPEMFGNFDFMGPWGSASWGHGHGRGRGRRMPGWRHMSNCWKKWARGGECPEKNEEKKETDKEPKNDDGTKPKTRDSESSSDEGEHSSTEDYLKNVGENVAAMLDPLGIDVEIDVEHGGRRRRFDTQGGPWGPWAFAFAGGRGNRCGRGRGGRSCPRRSPSKSQATPAPAPEPKPDQKQPEKAEPEKMEAQNGEEQTPDSVEMETGEATGATGKETPEVDNISDYIVTKETPKEDQKGAGDKAKEEEKSSDKEWTLLEGATPPPDSTQTTGIYPQVEVPAEPQPPTDPTIANALDHMKSMGFTNDGGWLTTLLQVTKGDINKALDAIRANRKM